jgi:hypothetical protein
MRGVGADAIALSSGWSVEPHNKHFRQGTEDTVWLPFVSRNQWVLLTHKRQENQKTSIRTANSNQFRRQEFCPIRQQLESR